MAALPLLCILLLLFVFASFTTDAQSPGFISIDCGGTRNYTDEIGLEWIPDNNYIYGETANIFVVGENRKQYQTLRHFPPDNRKYCYTLSVKSRIRYLVRATFLYGLFDSSSVFPKFDISFGATHWSTVVISDANTIEVQEAILLANSDSISVCLSNASTGVPFISTLELRQFNDSMYSTNYENQYFLSVSARINFGTVDATPVRYPDDPFDRIWTSDSLRRANFLVDVAPGTYKVSTRRTIYVNRGERPPEKVMQSAVVGQNGTLSYRLNLEGFPGSGWAFCYFAELEDLGSNDTRKFRLEIPGMPEYSKANVNVQENAQGRFRLYEPGYPNISFPFTLSFSFVKTPDSTMGPILNGFEINKYVQISAGSQDAPNAASLCSRYPLATWAQEGGDPCLPVPWSWVKCTSDQQPRIVTVNLSGKNLTGNVPPELSTLTGLTELWLDNNSFTGPIPDLSGCINLKIIHLENNLFTGEVPAYFAALPSLSELYLQNNMLSGMVPADLLHKNIALNFSANPDLHIGGGQKVKLIIGIVIGLFFLLVTAMLICCCLLRARGGKKKFGKVDLVGQISAAPSLPPMPSLPAPPSVSVFSDAATEGSHCFTLAEIETATGKFVKKVGSGGFGSVFYGKLNDGKEIAVKVLSANSYQGKREFSNEVSLLSRIHHRNLVAFLGYCQEGKSILVYEFMHNGTLKEHLYGPLTQEKSISWIKRLEIAEDAAKGIEYLHTGCIPTIIHRDLKTSNILLDKNMRAKVSDFGLSKVAIDGSTHVSSIVRGTVGYLDPEYYISQQLTEKSDVYSFGVILLELISGQEAISNDSFGANCRNIVQWAKLHIESGDIQQIIDPSLRGEFDIQSVWKVAEKAMMCVQPHGRFRPTISEVLKEIQEAISIEKGGSGSGGEDDFDMLSRNSRHSSINVNPLELAVSDSYLLLDESVVLPTAR